MPPPPQSSTGIHDKVATATIAAFAWIRQRPAVQQFGYAVVLAGPAGPLAEGLFGDADDRYKIGVYLPLFLLAIGSALFSAAEEDRVRSLERRLTERARDAERVRGEHAQELQVAERFGRSAGHLDWKSASEMHDIGLAHVYQHVANDPDVDPKEVVKEHLQNIAAIMRMVFGDTCVGLFVNIAVPNRARTQIKIVCASRERPGRRGRATIKFAGARANHGAVKCFHSGRPTYLADTTNLAAFRGKDYKSVMNFPVLSGTDEETLAVVNLDASVPFGFGPETSDGDEDREHAYAVCSPCLRAIALALQDGRAFANVRDV